MTTPPPRTRLLRLPEVQAATGLGSSSIYLLMQDADPTVRFPHPIKIGQRSRWIDAEVQDWIERLKARSRGQSVAA